LRDFAMYLFLLSFLGVGAAGAWPQYGGQREVTSLDGQWLFGFNASKDFDVLQEDFNTSTPGLTPFGASVPSSVDAVIPGVLGRRGVAMYRRTFQQKGPVRLQFMGCSFYCRVFVDGKEVGEHRAGGFVPWWLDVAPSGKETATRELFVLVDNRFNRTTAPVHTGGDFWHYGGLVRSVFLHDLPDDSQKPWVWRAHVLPSSTSLAQVDIHIILTSNFTGPISSWIAFDNAVETMFNATAKDGKFSLLAMDVPKPRLWSLEDPQLHTVTVKIFGASVTERFGLRRWGVDQGRLTLNGEKVKLHGWNHHTQWIDTGASPTDEQLDIDIALMKEGNANFVRGAHYPQDQRWLDRLDEGGFAMWEETLGPGVSLNDTQDWSHFMKYQLQQVEEMLEASMNHPSIMVWAWFNEGPSDNQAACPAYAACAKVAGRDPTRFLSWASSKQQRDQCLEHATAVSFNGYPAWYSNQHQLDVPARFWSENAAWVKEHYPEKPFFISETGAGGLFEWDKNKTDAYWTLKYQQEVIDRDVDVALTDTNVSGLTLWHFFDFKGNDEAQACGPCHYEPHQFPPVCAWYNMTGSCSRRPGGVNHKGVVDLYRRKKPSFESVKAKYGSHGSRLTKQIMV